VIGVIGTRNEAGDHPRGKLGGLQVGEFIDPPHALHEEPLDLPGSAQLAGGFHLAGMELKPTAGPAQDVIEDGLEIEVVGLVEIVFEDLAEFREQIDGVDGPGAREVEPGFGVIFAEVARFDQEPGKQVLELQRCDVGRMQEAVLEHEARRPIVSGDLEGPRLLLEGDQLEGLQRAEFLYRPL